MTVEFLGSDFVSEDEMFLGVALFITASADFDIYLNLTGKEDSPKSSICKQLWITKLTLINSSQITRVLVTIKISVELSDCCATVIKQV